MVHYKLIYFDVRGLGETIRLILKYANEEFEDVRFSHSDWPKYKSGTPYGKVPILEIDGKPLAECYTIARYLALKYGIAGVDKWEQAKVDEIADYLKDVILEVRPFFGATFGFLPGDKAKLHDEVFIPVIQRNFAIIEKKLSESGSGFLVKSGLTWVDFTLAEFLTTVNNVDWQEFQKYPKLMEYRLRVHSHPKIRDYIRTRKPSLS